MDGGSRAKLVLRSHSGARASWCLSFRAAGAPQSQQRVPMLDAAEHQELEAALATALTSLFKSAAVATARDRAARLEWIGAYLLGRAPATRAEQEFTQLGTVERNAIARELECVLGDACAEALRLRRASQGSIKVELCHRVGESLLRRSAAQPETRSPTGQLDSPVMRATSLAHVCEIWELLQRQRRHGWVRAYPPPHA